MLKPIAGLVFGGLLGLCLCAAPGLHAAQKAGGAATPAAADSTDIPGVDQTLLPDADAFLESDLTDPRGEDKEIRCGFEAGVEYRTVMHFDLSTLRKGVPVRSAILRICSFNGGSGKDYKFMRVQQLYRPFVETNVNWINAYQGNAWHLKGGDFLPEAYGGADLAKDAGGPKERWYSFDITRLVQGWQNGAYKNNGLEIMNEPGSDIMLRIYSREAAKNRPQLLIGYSQAITAPDSSVRAAESIQPLPVRPNFNPQIVTKTLNAGLTGQAFSVPLEACGGVRPYKWAAEGRLPEGFTLSDGGVLSGTSNKPITAQIRVKCMSADNKFHADTASFSIVIHGPVVQDNGPGGGAAGPGPTPGATPGKTPDKTPGANPGPGTQPKLPNDDG
ncbi:MAG: DNRLRE domain-containing protein [Planctomycetota bacterium]